MFRHPNVVAAFILSAGMMLSAGLICSFLHSLDVTLENKPMYGGSSVNFPDRLTLSTVNGDSFKITLHDDPINTAPLLRIKQEP